MWQDFLSVNYLKSKLERALSNANKSFPVFAAVTKLSIHKRNTSFVCRVSLQFSASFPSKSVHVMDEESQKHILMEKE